MDHDPMLVCLDELTEEQWIEIKKMAIECMDKKEYNEQFKCWIQGFLDWLDCNEKNVVINTDDFRTVH